MEGTNGRRNPHKFLQFPTHEPLFRQGHVGDLRCKSKIEIEELLERQEKVLSNRSFLSKLPDRGAKIECFVSSLRRRLNEIESLEADSSQTDSLNNTSSSINTSISDLDEIKTDEKFDSVPPDKSFVSDLSIVEKSFSGLAIHEGPHYEVIKRAAEKPKQSKFMLNKLKSKDAVIKGATSSSSVQKDLKIVTSANKNTKKVSDRDLSAATMSDPKQPAVLISIEESRSLYQKQEAAVKEQRSQLVAERILSKYISGDSANFSLSYDTDDENNDVDDVEDEDDLDDVD